MVYDYSTDELNSSVCHGGGGEAVATIECVSIDGDCGAAFFKLHVSQNPPATRRG
jgi:hypothetical protein